MGHQLGNVFGIWDYTVFCLLLLASSLIGVYFAWKGRGKPPSDFFSGGNQLALFPVTMSLVASFTSTNTLLGIPAEVYQVGTQFVIQVFSLCLVILLAAEVFLPVYYKLEVKTVNEYLFRRFNSHAVKNWGIIAFLMVTMPYMSVVLYGPAIALSSVIQIDITDSILVVGVICTFYTSIGGIKAVIWTDVLQCILMFLGIAIVIFQGVMELGGFWRVIEIADKGERLKLFNFKFDLYNSDNFWNVFSGTFVTWGACYCASQTQVQRYISMKSAKEAKKFVSRLPQNLGIIFISPKTPRTLYYNLPGLIVLTLMAIFSGMVIYGKYHDCDPVTLGIIERHDQLIPYYVMDTLSKYPGIPGLFVACVFSGSLSTLSSGFNALAAITWEDLGIQKRLNFDAKSSKNGYAVKFIAMCYGIAAILLSFCVGSLGTVLQASLSLSGSLLGPIFGLFSMAMLLRFVNAKGALTGSICGLAVSLTMSLGAIIIPRPHISMPTSVDNCSVELFQAYLADGQMNQTDVRQYIPYYENPVGIRKLVHVSYLIMSTSGFFVTVFVGILVSLATGGYQQASYLDERLLSPLCRLFPPYLRGNFKLKYETALVGTLGQMTPNSNNNNDHEKTNEKQLLSSF